VGAGWSKEGIIPELIRGFFHGQFSEVSNLSWYVKADETMKHHETMILNQG